MSKKKRAAKKMLRKLPAGGKIEQVNGSRFYCFNKKVAGRVYDRECVRLAKNVINVDSAGKVVYATPPTPSAPTCKEDSPKSAINIAWGGKNFTCKGVLSKGHKAVGVKCSLARKPAAPKAAAATPSVVTTSSGAVTLDFEGQRFICEGKKTKRGIGVYCRKAKAGKPSIVDVEREPFFFPHEGGGSELGRARYGRKYWKRHYGGIAGYRRHRRGR